MLSQTDYFTRRDDIPVEDFATSFAAFFMGVAGRPHDSLIGIDGMPETASVINKPISKPPTQGRGWRTEWKASARPDAF